MSVEHILSANAGHALPRDLILKANVSRQLTIPALRAASPLTQGAQALIDKVPVKIGLERLTVVADLLAMGLTYNLPNPLAVPMLTWERESKTGYAQRTMVPHARGENQMPARDVWSLPIYLTTDDFRLDIRTLMAAERVGMPLDTSGGESAIRRVNESIEDATINGSGVVVGAGVTADGTAISGGTAYGLLTAPGANTVTLTATKWTSAVDGGVIVTDVLSMISAAVGDHKYGPYTLYVGTDFGIMFNRDYSAVKGEGTIRQRLEALDVGGGKLRIVIADRMPANKAVLVQMTSDVIEMVVGQKPTILSWQSADKFTTFFMAMGIMIPRIRSDYDGQSGVVIGTAVS